MDGNSIILPDGRTISAFDSNGQPFSTTHNSSLSDNVIDDTTSRSLLAFDSDGHEIFVAMTHYIILPDGHIFCGFDKDSHSIFMNESSLFILADGRVVSAFDSNQFRS
jgi:hypothetical protein